MNTLVLGIGNVLWADEGFGIRCVENLNANYMLEAEGGAEVMDGGTQGIYLVHHVEEAEYLLVFDAVDYGLEPGEVKVVRDEDVPAFLGVKKVSLHQTGFQEVLATAQLKGNYPTKITLIGVQPEDIEDYGGSLSATVKPQVSTCVDLAIEELKSWGVSVTRRVAADGNSVLSKELNMHKYERERPSSDMAPRLGDERVLLDTTFSLRDQPLIEDEGLTSVPVDGRKLFED